MWLFCTECRPKRPVLYIIPVTDILGRLALVPYGEHGTIPYDWQNRTQLGKPQLVMLPVCVRQAEACDPMGMEVVDEVADLFAQE